MGAILFLPQVSTKGAKSGLIICGDVLIPSLFPFAVPVLFLINTDLFGNLKCPIIPLYILSLIGGYPVGAKLINEFVKENRISELSARKVLPFCVNAGPAFIVLAIGKSMLGNIVLGYILLASHCLASIICFLFFARKELFIKQSIGQNKPFVMPSDNFVASINNASSTCLLICAFVVFFSVLNSYIGYIAEGVPALYPLLYLTEVTSAVTQTENVLIISFLLGFGGFSVWMQVFSVSGKAKPSLLSFAFVRILHGLLSAAITLLLLKIFRVNILTLSTGVTFSAHPTHNGYAQSIALLFMALLLLYSISKKHSGNLLKDMI